jgi:hypothetical protein
MAKIADADFEGDSGSKYSFIVYPFGQAFKAVGGVYIVTKRTVKSDGGGSHDFIYIGQTGDLSARFDDHHKAECFKKYGANCICVHVSSDESQRFEIETDLCRHHSTRCND